MRINKALPTSAPVIVTLPSPGVEEPRVALPETVRSPVISVLSLRERFPLLSEMASVTVRDPPTVVFPVEDKVVNAPVEGVLKPIAVPLIPVAVVLKFPEVISVLFAPAFKVIPASPVALIDPDVAVKFNAPVVSVNPLEAVSVALDVIAPVPVVTILPDVDRVPFSLMVNVSTLPYLTAKEVFIPTFVSSITNAVAVPSLVMLKLESLAVSARVNPMLRASVVVMVLPSS